jgi:hypothetical protein
MDEYVIGVTAKDHVTEEHVPVMRQLLEANHAKSVFIVLLGAGFVRLSFHLHARSRAEARERGTTLVENAMAEAGAPARSVEANAV